MSVTPLILFLLVVFSASFSSFETAIFSLTPLQRYRLGKVGGLFTLIPRLLEHPRELLMTVLLGNELVNVAISILGAGLAYDLLRGYDQRNVYLISTCVTTLVVLIFGEIVPKNIAVRTPIIVSQFLLVPYQIFSWVVFPFRVLFTRLGDGIVRLMGADPQKGRRLIVEEELRSLLEVGKKEGTLADLERTLIQNSLDFSGVTVEKVMIPRQKVFSVPAGISFREILEMIEENRYSRIPVFERNTNHIVGILHAKELLPFRLQEAGLKRFVLMDLLKPHLELSPQETLDHVFQEFQTRKIHSGIVRDEAGNFVGLITMDDLLRRFFT